MNLDYKAWLLCISLLIKLATSALYLIRSLFIVVDLLTFRYTSSGARAMRGFGAMCLLRRSTVGACS